MGKLELVIESDNVSIYSPKYDGETQTEFEKFMSDNGSLPQPQLKKDFGESEHYACIASGFRRGFLLLVMEESRKS